MTHVTSHRCTAEGHRGTHAPPRPAAVRHRRLRRRRQVHPRRPPAARLQVGPHRPAGGRRARSPRAAARSAADLALLTDGLRAEREQGITIDVAYRYFATARRPFILADTPGHVQYTRNMVTGASTAELAVVLVDARNGVVEQTRRHAAVAALLRVPHVVARRQQDGPRRLTRSPSSPRSPRSSRRTRPSSASPDVTAIPISALAGDNVVEPSAHTDWYGGPTLLEHLETVPVSHDPRRTARAASPCST